MDDNPSRRTVLGASGLVAAGLAGCLDSEGDDNTGQNGDENDNANGNENGNENNFENELTWGGQGDEFATLDCEDDEVGFWKWILTPGGQPPIEEGAQLTVTYEDNTTETYDGFRPGEGQGAVQFEAFKDGGGTVESAFVEFDGGGDNPVLTISEAECREGEDDEKELEVETEPATEINGSTATLNGVLTEIGDFTEVEVFFEWRNIEDDDFQQTDRQTLTETGPFSAEIDVEPGESYEFRAVVEANDHRVVGVTLDFEKDDDDKEEEKDKPDVKEHVDVKVIKHKEKNGTVKARVRVYNDSDHDLKLSWDLKDGKDGEKIEVPKGGKTNFWVYDATKYEKVYIRHDGETVAYTKLDDKDDHDEYDKYKEYVDVDVLDYKHKDGKVKIKCAIYNDLDHKLKFSWNAKGSNYGGKISVPANGKDTFWVGYIETSSKIEVLVDGDVIMSIDPDDYEDYFDDNDDNDDNDGY